MLDGITLGDWGQIAVGAAAIVAAIVYSKRQIDKRKFVHQIKMTPIIKIDGVSSDDIEIRFKGLLVKTLSLYSISFLNLGNRPILRSDWDECLRILFPSNVQVVEFRVSASMPKELNLLYEVSDELECSEVKFSPFLLNPKEGFRAEIVVAGEELPKVSARIVGVTKIEHLGVDGRNLLRSTFTAMLVVPLIFLFIYLDGVDGKFFFDLSPSFIAFIFSIIFGLWATFFGRKFPTPLHIDEDFLRRSD